MKNSTILLIVGLIALIYLFTTQNNEPFSASGLAISDEDCTKLASVYYRPRVNNPFCRDQYLDRICGRRRRDTIDYDTGNYYTSGDILV